MRQLRFVGPGRDRDHVILETADGGEQFVLYIDAQVRDAVRSDLPRLHPAPPEPPAPISPREIQMRVRAGASPQDIADANEMPIDRVLRFASPVIEERGRVAQEARRARARRGTGDGQTVVFGDAVDMRFSAHGIEPSSVNWDARRREDGQWIVSAAWLGGDAERMADWAFHLTTRSVTPMDDTAADLLSDRPIRPAVTEEPPERPTLAAAPPLAPGVVAFPVMESATDASPRARDDVFDQDALDEDPRRVGDTDTLGYIEPQLPLRLAGPQEPTAELPRPAETSPPAPKIKNLGIAHRDDETEDERAARARVPSWDDILMGVRRKQD
ncbi:MAG TPA: septation protein SepH [Jatrophihabitantaceae bacterium]|jgi:hypothetical protein|nr:septation protein SepH [Jatrophihabitantaceae bacterium]